MKKVLSQTTIYEVCGRKLEVFINTELLNKMNWSWESLCFADNSEMFAHIEDISTGEILTLDTEGEVKVKNWINNDYLSIDEVKNLSFSEYIYDESKYSIESNNWFSLNFSKLVDEKVTLLEDYVFESEPKNIDELTDVLIHLYLQYFEEVVAC